MTVMIGTRTDLAFAIQKLSQHQDQPLHAHWIAVKRVLPFIVGARDLSILFRGDNDLDLIGYSDSDWAECRESGKSRSGFVFMLARGSISWWSKKQMIFTLSTFEMEYFVVSLACTEAIWLSRHLAHMLLHSRPTCVELRNENSSSVAMAINSVVNQRNKHIDLKYHFVRDCHQQKRAHLVKWPKSDHADNTCTKAPDRVKLEHHINSLRSGHHH